MTYTQDYFYPLTYNAPYISSTYILYVKSIDLVSILGVEFELVWSALYLKTPPPNVVHNKLILKM